MKQYLCHLSTQIFIRCDHVLQRVIVTRKISQLAWRILLAQQCKCNSCHGPGWVQSMLSLMPLMSFSFHVPRGARFFFLSFKPQKRQTRSNTLMTNTGSFNEHLQFTGPTHNWKALGLANLSKVTPPSLLGIPGYPMKLSAFTWRSARPFVVELTCGLISISVIYSTISVRFSPVNHVTF